MLNRISGFFRADLAMDLGTASTLIGAPGDGVILQEPSVVAVGTGNNRILSGGCAVGHLAKLMFGRTPRSISVVKPLREGVIADFELCESMLRYFMRKAQQRRWAIGPRVLVAAPSGVTPVQRRAIFNSVRRAGASEVIMISEAKAAAIGVGLPITEPVGSMICDIGGGTTDVTVLSLSETVAQRSIRMGGDQMDQAIVDSLYRNFSLRIGETAAEQLRMDIGSAFPLAEELVAEISGVDAISGLPRKITVNSQQIRDAIAECLHQIVDAIKRTIDQCSPDLASDLVEQGFVLVGGGSRLRSLEPFLEEHTGIPCRIAPDPNVAITLGTMTCLEHLEQWQTSIESSDDL